MAAFDARWSGESSSGQAVVTTEPVIRVQALRKSYGRTVAVDGVSFEVERGASSKIRPGRGGQGLILDVLPPADPC